MSKNNHDNSKARLCHIEKWDHFDGYGFNLHAEKGKPGQYIGKVDEGSPAEAAGLRQGDRILEVNGEPIANKSHKQVVDLIKKHPNETTLLVIDPHDPEEEGNGNGPDGNGIILTTELEKITDKQQSNNNSSSNGNQVHEEKHQENGTLNLSMTAAELRAKLAEKKKFDPKKQHMDFKQKFDIVQKL